MDSVTLNLRQPIEAHGENVKAITLAPPTGKDLGACGFVPADKMGTPEFGNFIRSMMSRMAKIPPHSVDLMHPHDWFDAMNEILRFLVPGTPPKTVSTAILTQDAPSAPSTSS